MAPSSILLGALDSNEDFNPVILPRKTGRGHPRSDATLDGNILEAWSQGFMVGGLIVLIMITIANMRAHVLLHKLILLELIMALGHGTFIFCPDPYYGWYLSSTAIFLYLSWYLHNIVAWIKNKPFLPRWGSRLYIGSVMFIFPYWISEMYLNFNYFNGLGNDSFIRTRPWEALARDPWWIFTTCDLIYIIKREYNFGLFELIRASPRFGVLIISMFLSIVFLVADVVVSGAHISANDGINPYWKLALVFKCAADAMFLDDFKKVLDVLITHSIAKVGGHVHTVAEPPSGADQHRNHDFGLQPVQSATSHHSSRRSCSIFKSKRSASVAGASASSHSGRRHILFSMPRFGPSARPPSHESLRSDDKFLQKPEAVRTSSSGRRPTLEWFDVGIDGDTKPLQHSTPIPEAEVSPTTQGSPSPMGRQSNNGQNMQFATSAI
ncbi:MAG: hypothetical protein M4579_001326 [Chaenotheca gracillima]|nr:MAG: hypothetical protein M4579_001326 [Chaenotheca gracillima]